MPSAPVRVPRCLSAPTPGWTTTADVIVVGSGIAGLTCALQLRQHVGRVLLVTKTVLNEGSTAWAQGGIAAALDPEDSPEEHLEDTLVAGVGLCDVEAVRVLVTEGPQRVRELVALGAEFDRTDDGEIKLTREGGHHRDRIAHAGGDATGKEISRALIEALRRVVDDPGIEVIEHALVVDLLTDEEDRVAGTTLHVIGEGQIDGVGAAYASAVVLATGGLGQIYTSTTNPPVSTGDGMAAALRAGARITDLEFIQFHPTVLWLGEGSTGQQPLISEAVRGEGAFLVDRDGVRFMQGQHELADLAPRDVVARAILARMRETGTDHVFLDARHLGAEFLEERFPSIVASCRSLGFDPATDLLPVTDGHYESATDAETDLPLPLLDAVPVRDVGFGSAGQNWNLVPPDQKRTEPGIHNHGGDDDWDSRLAASGSTPDVRRVQAVRPPHHQPFPAAVHLWAGHLHGCALHVEQLRARPIFRLQMREDRFPVPRYRSRHQHLLVVDASRCGTEPSEHGSRMLGAVSERGRF